MMQMQWQEQHNQPLRPVAVQVLPNQMNYSAGQQMTTYGCGAGVPEPGVAVRHPAEAMYEPSDTSSYLFHL